MFSIGWGWGDKFGSAIENGDHQLATEIYQEFNKRHVDMKGPIWAGNHMWFDFDNYIDRLFFKDEFPNMEELSRFRLLDLLFKISGCKVGNYMYTKKNCSDNENIYDKYIKYLGPRSDIKPTPQKRERNERPRKPDTAYMFFMKEYRSKTKKENPNINFVDFTKIAFDKWKEMSDEERTPYLEKHKIDKERYEKELNDEKNARYIVLYVCNFNGSIEVETMATGLKKENAIEYFEYKFGAINKHDIASDSYVLFKRLIEEENGTAYIIRATH
jgi:hypothetical protein